VVIPNAVTDDSVADGAIKRGGAGAVVGCGGNGDGGGGGGNSRGYGAGASDDERPIKRASRLSSGAADKL
jgi:hypothetical protein